MKLRTLISAFALAATLVACTEVASESIATAEINHDGPEYTVRLTDNFLKTVQPLPGGTAPHLTSWQSESVWVFGDQGLTVGALLSEFIPDGCTLRKFVARVNRTSTSSAMTMRVVNGTTDYANISSGTTVNVGPELLNSAMSRILPPGSDARVYVSGQGFQQGLYWIDVTYTCPNY